MSRNSECKNLRKERRSELKPSTCPYHRPLNGAIPFAVPGGPLIPILAAAVIVWLLSNATRREFGVEALVLAVAAMFYFIRRTGGQL